MSSRNKKKPLSDDDLANAKRLKEIWVREKGSLTQAKAAEIMGFESQGAVSHYLNGRSALNVAAVLKFSSLLNVPPENIAPNLDYGCNGLRVMPESNIMPTQMHNKGVDYLNSSPIAQQLSESIIHLSASGKLDDSTCDAIGVLLGLGGGKGQGMMNKSIGKK